MRVLRRHARTVCLVLRDTDIPPRELLIDPGTKYPALFVNEDERGRAGNMDPPADNGLVASEEVRECICPGCAEGGLIKEKYKSPGNNTRKSVRMMGSLPRKMASSICAKQPLRSVTIGRVC